MNYGAYRLVLFDWGNTLMVDDPHQAVPMVFWPQVTAVPGAGQLLEYLSFRGIPVGLATSADISSEAQIRGALARVGFERYIGRIYSFTNTGVRKIDPQFYRHILDDQGLDPGTILMVGDSFEYDVLAPSRLGMNAAWFNPGGSEERSGENYITFHCMADLLACFHVSTLTA